MQTALFDASAWLKYQNEILRCVLLVAVLKLSPLEESSSPHMSVKEVRIKKKKKKKKERTYNNLSFNTSASWGSLPVLCCIVSDAQEAASRTDDVHPISARRPGVSVCQDPLPWHLHAGGGGSQNQPARVPRPGRRFHHTRTHFKHTMTLLFFFFFLKPDK